jgi:hypothetical protein
LGLATRLYIAVDVVVDVDISAHHLIGISDKRLILIAATPPKHQTFQTSKAGRGDKVQSINTIRPLRFLRVCTSHLSQWLISLA